LYSRRKQFRLEQKTLRPKAYPEKFMKVITMNVFELSHAAQTAETEVLYKCCIVQLGHNSILHDVIIAPSDDSRPTIQGTDLKLPGVRSVSSGSVVRKASSPVSTTGLKGIIG
jgi:hypothetical protein